MASSISSVEDKKYTRICQFFWSAYFHKKSRSATVAKKIGLLHAHNLGVQCTDCQCGAPWKQWSYAQAWHMLSEAWGGHQQGTGCLCQNTLCKLLPATFFLRNNLRAHRDWAKNCSGKRNGLYLGALSSSAPPIWCLPILFQLGNHHVHSRMTGKQFPALFP